MSHERSACSSVIAVCLCLVSSLSATSVIVQLRKGRIILAADTRQDRVNPTHPAVAHDYHDDGCKIVPLGSTAAGISGNLDYVRNDPSDGIPDWDALLDAKASYEREGNDVQAMATDWGERAKRHYDIFYLYAPRRVRDMANANSERVLVDAFFTGWEDSKVDVPLLVWEKVYLDESSLPVIRIRSQVLPPRETPYTTNALTQELIEGNSDRTKSVAKKWQLASRKVAKRELDWRWVEFIIKSTHDYEDDVGERVNVVQIMPGHKAQWLQNLTCSK